MNRRDFLRRAFATTAAGLLVPEHLLEPLKGRSMVTVPAMAAPLSFAYAFTVAAHALGDEELKNWEVGSVVLGESSDLWTWTAPNGERNAIQIGAAQ